MNPMAVPAAATHFHELLREHFGSRLKEARLFGSYARGEANEDSDVDVFALIDGLSHEDKVAAAYLAADTMLAEGVAVQSLAWSPQYFARMLELELGLALDIQNEGIVL